MIYAAKLLNLINSNFDLFVEILFAIGGVYFYFMNRKTGKTLDATDQALGAVVDGVAASGHKPTMETIKNDFHVDLLELAFNILQTKANKAKKKFKGGVK